MIPKNNKERFVKKYGNLWYLRDLDFFPQNLADCGYNMTAKRMQIALSNPKRWAVYDDYIEAVKASIKVREALGFSLSEYPSKEALTYKFE